MASKFAEIDVQLGPDGTLAGSVNSLFVIGLVAIILGLGFCLGMAIGNKLT